MLGRPTPVSASEKNNVVGSVSAIGREPLMLFGRRAMRVHLKKMHKGLRHLEEHDASEAIHKLRVTTRAIRATLEVLGETAAFDATHLHALVRRLKRLTRALGAVRDCDVFLGRIVEFEREHPSQLGGLQPLRAAIAERRDGAEARLHHQVRRRGTTRLLRDLRHLARDSEDADQADAASPRLVRHVAGSAIWRRYEAVLAFEALMPDATIETLHALRIACKQLRYVVELFDVAEDAEQNTFPALLRFAQDHLGKLHDSVVDLAIVDEVCTAHPEATALFTLAETLTAERDLLTRGVPPLWGKLTDMDARTQLAALIATF